MVICIPTERKDRFTMPRALLSVHDKTGVVELAQALASLGWDLVASGGTSKALTDAGLTVTPVERVTNSPEMLGGRVKTLHPAIHAGIFARVTVLCDPADYGSVIAQLRGSGKVNDETRRKLAIKAFEQTRDYDTAISGYLIGEALAESSADALPETFSLHVCKLETLRYGENPHQIGRAHV